MNRATPLFRQERLGRHLSPVRLPLPERQTGRRMLTSGGGRLKHQRRLLPVTAAFLDSLGKVVSSSAATENRSGDLNRQLS